MKRKKVKNLRRIPLLLLSLAVLVWGFAPTAQAASFTALDPADYVYDTDVDGDVKTVKYLFSTTPFSRINAWIDEFGWLDEVTCSGNFAMNFTYGDYHYTKIWFRSNFTGSDVWENSAISDNVIDIHDIMPGAPVTLSCEFSLAVGSTGTDDAADLVGTNFECYFNTVIFYFDEAGNYLGKVSGNDFNYSWGAVNNTSGSNFQTTFTVPDKAYYIAPCLNANISIPETVDTDAKIRFYFGSLSMTTDINMVYENSQTMEAINDKLEDIWTGGAAGDQLGEAGDSLDAAGDLTAGNMQEVTDFENDMIGNINDGMDQIEVITGVGSFASSLKFVSGYVEDIFLGVEEWSIVIMLPLFLGLVMYICSYSGSVTRLMRVVHEREDKRSRENWESLAKYQIEAANGTVF